MTTARTLYDEMLDRIAARKIKLVNGKLMRGGMVFSSDEGHWITIGAKPGEDGKKHGGTPVMIDGSGSIAKGPANLTGKTVGQISKTSGIANAHRRTMTDPGEGYRREKTFGGLKDHRPLGEPRQAQAWEQTSDQAGGNPDEHEKAVADALARGEDVPQDVLDEYPHLDPATRGEPGESAGRHPVNPPVPLPPESGEAQGEDKPERSNPKPHEVAPMVDAARAAEGMPPLKRLPHELPPAGEKAEPNKADPAKLHARVEELKQSGMRTDLAVAKARKEMAAGDEKPFGDKPADFAKKFVEKPKAAPADGENEPTAAPPEKQASPAESAPAPAVNEPTAQPEAANEPAPVPMVQPEGTPKDQEPPAPAEPAGKVLVAGKEGMSADVRARIDELRRSGMRASPAIAKALREARGEEEPAAALNVPAKTWHPPTTNEPTPSTKAPPQAEKPSLKIEPGSDLDKIKKLREGGMSFKDAKAKVMGEQATPADDEPVTVIPEGRDPSGGEKIPPKPSPVDALKGKMADKPRGKSPTGIAAIEAELKSHGVENVKLPRNSHLAKLTLEAVKIAKAHGMPIPKSISLLNPTGNRAIAYSSPTNGIGLTRGNVNAEKFQKSVDSGHNSQANPVLHEMAHLHHAKSVGIDKFDRHDNWMSPDAHRKIAEKVSRYARTNPKEFVAETLAGMLAGKSYPDDVMNLYKMHGGPEIKKADA